MLLESEIHCGHLKLVQYLIFGYERGTVVTDRPFSEFSRVVFATKL